MSGLMKTYSARLSFTIYQLEIMTKHDACKPPGTTQRHKRKIPHTTMTKNQAN